MSNTDAQAPGTLQAAMDQAGGAVKLLRSGGLGPYVFPVIPPEFTNWRDEMRAWKNEVALLELSFHMCELHLRGPQVIDLLSALAVNKFSNFPVMRAKQLVLAGHDGYYIADAIVFHEEEDFYRIVGAPFASDWVQYNVELGGYDVQATRNDSFSVRQGPRDVYRVQVQGKHALDVMRRASDNTLPEIKFFHMGQFQIGGRTVRALRHGMAGEAGFEIYGPWEDQDFIRNAIMEAGAEFGIRKIGANAYPVSGVESAWMPMPLPAIYHSEEMRPYREWLSAYHMETIGSIGGSLVSEDITDYYVDPIELGYGGLVDWSRDFLGRDALEKRKAEQRRVKRTLVWNEEDVLAVQKATLFPHGDTPARAINMPYSPYATFPWDAVMRDGVRVGASQLSGYTPNAEAYMSLALINIEHAEPGTELTLLWGEPNSTRPTVEKNEAFAIRAIVAPAPYFEKVIKSGAQ
jgi:vanillate/3-O-methylgallate O-demethylase